MKGRNYSEAWKQRQRARREAAAIRAMEWALMALLVGALIVLLAFPARADEQTDRSVALLAAYALADYQQSVDMFYHRHPSAHEINPVLGEKPSRRSMALFGIAGVLATALIGSIDHPLARIAVDSIVASEQFNIEENERVRNGQGRQIDAILVIIAWRF
jgi:hypothetical protein